MPTTVPDKLKDSRGAAQGVIAVWIRGSRSATCRHFGTTSLTCELIVYFYRRRVWPAKGIVH